MDNSKYNILVNKYKPKEDKLKKSLTAFIVGGLMGVLAQLLIEFYAYIFLISSKEASTIMIVTFIFIGCLFTSLGFFDTLVTKAGCGLIVPITGFAHAMQSAALEYRKEGFVTGIGANMFKLAGSVIVYGVVSAYLFGLIRLIIGGI